MSYANYTDEQIASLGYVLHKTKVDFVLRPASPQINLIQGDENLQMIKIKLLERGNPFSIKPDDRISFKMGKIDHTFVWIDIFGVNLEDKSVYVKVVNQMCTIPGRMLASVLFQRPTQETFEPYSSNSTYEIGDNCMFENETYTCVVAVEEPEEFDPEKWKKTLYRAHTSLLLFNIERNPIQEHFEPSEIDIGIITDLVERAETAATNAEDSEQQAAQYLEEFEHELATMVWFDKIITNSEIDDLFT